MFDKTFFRFALGFAAIIALSVGLMYVAERFDSGAGDDSGSPVSQPISSAASR